MKLPFEPQLFANLPRAYLVGGSVRDLLRDKEPLDFDVVVETDALLFARQVAERLRGKVITLGKENFIVHRVISKNLTIDVSPIKGMTLDADLMARDFTFNALACDLTGGEIIDLMDGVADLHNGVVRMVSPNNFRDDPARLIRAFRMAAALEFQIEPRTLQTISAQAGAIGQVAGERIWAEIERIVASLQSVQILQQMAETQLLFQIIPELFPLIGCEQNQYHSADVFNHTIKAYGAMEDQLNTPDHSLPGPCRQFISQMETGDQVMIKFAILLHDIGKPGARSVDEKGIAHFYGHAGRGAAIAKEVCRRLRTSNRLQIQVESIIRFHQRPLSLYLARQRSELRPKSVGRFFRQCSILTPYILMHAIADDMGKGNFDEASQYERIRFYHELIERYFSATEHYSNRAVISGHDLMKTFGMRPSPLMGKVLRSVKELQMAGALNSRQEAMAWISEFLDQKSKR